MSRSESVQIIPWSGETLDISTASGARRGMEEAALMRAQLNEFNNACRATLIEEADRRGQLSWTDEQGVKVIVGGDGVAEKFDMVKLAALTEAGLPQERWNDLVSWEPKVNGHVLLQLRRNPAYAAIIDGAVTETKPKYRAVRFG